MKKFSQLCLFLILMFSIFSIKIVSAESTSVCGLSNAQLLKRYGVSVDDDGSIITVSAAPDSSLEKLKDLTFTVTQVNNKVFSETFTANKSVTFDTQLNKDDDLVVYIETTDPYISETDETCTNKNTISFKYEIDRGDIVADRTYEFSDEESSLSSKAITCNSSTYKNDYKDDQFKLKFCEAKLNASKKYDFGEDKKYSDSAVSFKCEYISRKSASELTGNDYYVNSSYLYGKGTKTVNLGEYVYNYEISPSSKSISCDLTCEEAVIVEYGPPVASTAGLCFEYKIRVTSRVNCWVSKQVNKPSSATLCTPTARCVHNGVVYEQGGPTEDFDSCIQSCDGGKYTEKCSKECYSKVYGNSSSSASNISALNMLSYAEKLGSKSCTAADTNEHGGCYYYEGGKIQWYDSSNNYSYGRYYSYSKWFSRKNSSAYKVFQHDGFFRRNYNGDYCHDSCSWVDNNCSGKYLNPGSLQQDYDKNKSLYSNAKKQCEAQAACSTSKTEFTISVDYMNSSGKVTLEFPNTSSKKDILCSRGADSSTCTSTTTTNTTLLNTDIETYRNSCYDKDSETSNQYNAAWSFPGSWINNKTGEISYEDKTGTTGWQTIKNKFCLPIDAKNVNIDWWNYYQSKFIDNSYSSTTTTTYNETCKGGNTKIRSDCTTTITDPPTEDQVKSWTDDDITWNIKGSTRNFGYFEWDIDISCFYAINDNPSCVGTSSSTDNTDECITDSSNYRVRTVDLTDLFPSISGKEISSASETGRTPGFNWSEFANNTLKNENYTSTPSSYVSYVQKNGYSIYSDNYLDYEFELSPSDLANMKGKKSSYTDYDQTKITVDSSGLTRYQSPFIDSYGRTGKIAKLGALKCNNMKNYNSTECEEIGG